MAEPNKIDPARRAELQRQLDELEEVLPFILAEGGADAQELEELLGDGNPAQE